MNFLGLFCQDLQKLLKPIYDLPRMGRMFDWGPEQQEASDEIKWRLQKPSVLHMPDNRGRFHLYSDISKFATCIVLYQIQNGQPKLIVYVSKGMPSADQNSSTIELELCGLLSTLLTSHTCWKGLTLMLL